MKSPGACCRCAKPEAPAAGNRYALLAVLLVPLIALPVYAKYGSPLMPDVPLQESIEGGHRQSGF